MVIYIISMFTASLIASTLGMALTFLFWMFVIRSADALHDISRTRDIPSWCVDNISVLSAWIVLIDATLVCLIVGNWQQ